LLAFQGLPGPGRASRNSGVPTDDDLVNRRFNRDGLNELWVSDITEDKTREGKIYCVAVLDTCSRKIVGWSIDSVQDSQLVVNALDVAIKQRKPRPGGVVHALHGVQGGFNRSSQHFMIMEVCDGASSIFSGSCDSTEDEIAWESAASA